MVQELNRPYLLAVALPTQVDRVFTYQASRSVMAGTRVVVPFGNGNRSLVGVVIGPGEPPNGKVQLKEIIEIIDDSPVYSEVLLKMAKWLSEYYVHPLGDVLKTMLPGSHQKVTSKSYKLTPKGEQQRQDESAEHHDVLKFVFARKDQLTVATLRKRLRQWGEQGDANGDLDQQTLVELGLCETVNRQALRTRRSTGSQQQAAVTLGEPPQVLTPAQQEVFQQIRTQGLEMASAQRKPCLLWGVTGAGKTEIYLQLIQAACERTAEAQALVLVPEISLTPQMTHVFEARFPGQVAVVHSAMTDTERWTQLERIRQQDARILVGPRSAVFAPFASLELILVDEEHDQSYKQTTGLCYHGRDVAVVRGKMEGALVVLGSATPSLESFWNSQTGKYHFMRLSERVGGRTLPSIEVVPQRWKRRLGHRLPNRAEDLLADIPISDRILAGLKETIERREQAMVIVNRRGFAYYLFSLDRQEPVTCPHCSVSLTVHKKSQRLRCHYCDYHVTIREVQHDRREETLVTVGYGSEQAEDFLREALPDARIVRVDSDTVQKKDALAKILRDFRDKKIDILVGTQILAKGHDFANVTLICLLEIDQSLNLPDFRAGERTFQLIVQAAGRAGRANLPGHVMIQCQKPNHPLIQAALRQDYLAFTDMEIGFRQGHHYPPFARMVALEWNGVQPGQLAKISDEIQGGIDQYFASRPEECRRMMILGPATPPVEVIRGRHRRSLIVAGQRLPELRRLIFFLRRYLNRLPKDVRFKIDCDPQSLL